MIKLKLLLESMTEWFYHATTAKALPGIMERGLLPAEETNWGGDLGKWSEGKVFLTDRFKRAVFYGNAGIWQKEHINQFKPLLRIRLDKTELEEDPQSNDDYYSEIPIRGNFEIFVPTEETETPDERGNVLYAEFNSEWRPLTKDIADAIATGEWDGETIDDKENYD
jgi:hypothetical protein